MPTSLLSVRSSLRIRRELRILLAVAIGASLAGLATLLIVAPAYLRERGFPLDDAWIHAVYGRELARSGTLAYNPGVPATGATSLLWAAVVAVPHVLFGPGAATVLAIKLIGLSLLAATAFVAASASGPPESTSVRLGAALVALHAPMLAGSVSGMEVSLAALTAAVLLACLRRGPALLYGLVCGAAPLARPELAVLGLGLPLLLVIGEPADRRRALRLWGAGVLGTSISSAAVAVRNVAASGLPLPATFYAKVRAPLSDAPANVARGFGELLGDLPLGGLPLVAAGSAIAAAALWVRKADAPRAASGVWVAGLAICALSFILIPPVDPVAFYHQRYALPGVALLLAAAPSLVAWALAWIPRPGLRRLSTTALAVAAFLAVALDAPGRLRRLDNDARNIDDVQVAVGRALASARSTDTAWAVDAGAVRYFGAAFVVDTLALNTPELLGEGSSDYLAAHPPTYLELVPGWSRVTTDGGAHLPLTSFTPTTLYTVTSFQPMRLHVLARCAPSVQGTFEIRGRPYTFTCPPAQAERRR